MDEKSNIYLELYKIQTERFKDTRQIQWQINTAFWTFILVSSAFLYGKYQITIVEGFFIVILFTGLHVFWCFFIQKSLNVDKKLIEKYRNYLETKTKTETVTETATEGKSWHWIILQSLVTMIFLLFFVCFLGKDIKNQEPNNETQMTTKRAR